MFLDILRVGVFSAKKIQKRVDGLLDICPYRRPFKFKRAASEGAASWEGERQVLWKSKKLFSKKWKFSKKVLTTENEIALMGGLFKFKRAASKEAASCEGEREKVLWNLLSTIVRTSQKFFWQQLWKKSNESWWKRHHLKTDVERFKNL